jgi:hypothetical protein
MTLYLNLSTARLPNAYYLYSPSAPSSPEPPDACLVFSGLNASSARAPTASRLSATLRECMLDSSQGEPSACPFNPSIWSARSPANTPVAKLFGTTESSNEVVTIRYNFLRQRMQAAFERFNQTFLKTAQRMKIELFSADGDFIHDFFDCVFLGPYTRVDMLPCDLNGRLECPYYARYAALSRASLASFSCLFLLPTHPCKGIICACSHCYASWLCLYVSRCRHLCLKKKRALFTPLLFYLGYPLLQAAKKNEHFSTPSLAALGDKVTQGS